MSFSIASGLVLVFASLISKAVPSEVLNGLDEQELSSIAYRLQDEKQQRLILKNDVDVMMLKIGLMERSIEEIKKSKRKFASTSLLFHTAWMLNVPILRKFAIYFIRL